MESFKERRDIEKHLNIFPCWNLNAVNKQHIISNLTYMTINCYKIKANWWIITWL